MADENRYGEDPTQNREEKYDIQPLIDEDTDLPHDQVAEDLEYADEIAPTARANAYEAGGEDFTAEEFASTSRANARDEEYADEIAPTARAEARDEDFTAEEFASTSRVNTRDEETAAEVSPTIRGRQYGAENDFDRIENEEQMQNIEAMEEEEASGTGLGWTALVLSIISLFFLPLLTASIGVITGFFAHRNGARTLGVWAIVVGLFSIVLSLFFAPFI